MPAITTLLVANRGEIARRVMRTARLMGIRTVAVFSDADADSPHVLEADVAVALGGLRSSDSYLSVDKVLDAARRTGADAVHPGYGFLSENAAFAEACAAAGLIFVGPRPETIRDMGLKDRAKQIAVAAGVPVLPDAAVLGDDPAAWRAAAASVGYPLLVKATAGGGGKGMHVVHEEADLEETVARARRESSAAFGDATVFLERYLVAPRHIEIQVFGDQHGGAIHLIERECSIQRRHQKVIEEAPSPAVTPELRSRMGATAVGLVRDLAYVGAGTVEFLVGDGPEQGFWFLEMNTRLQVEHPTTEEVTGLDLVRLQLDVAMGKPLPIGQQDVVVRGHAIEARLYAEDAQRDFAPTPGQLHSFDLDERPGIRLEVGIASPGEVSPFYDPMLAKVIAHAADRDEAARRLATELAAARIHGITTNRDFLVQVLRSPDFLAGQTRTDFVERHPELLSPAPAQDVEVLHLAAAVAVGVAGRRAVALMPWAPPGWRGLSGQESAAEWQLLTSAAEPVRTTYRLRQSDGSWTLSLGLPHGKYEVAVRSLDPNGCRVSLDGCERACSVASYADGTTWVSDGEHQSGWRQLLRLPEADRPGDRGQTASMPGTVVAVHVAPGDTVEAGQVLVVLEAMKMEHQLRAEVAGTVEDVLVTVGQFVAAEAPLVRLVSS
ncbi:MAG: acetyl/propionyl-CoA carboxylase subunit alpha [Frankiales bacterium]|nr:acetyl/propionyl-CoA carboxylase subunit alpha [Frankiales bacterium]